MKQVLVSSRYKGVVVVGCLKDVVIQEDVPQVLLGAGGLWMGFARDAVIGVCV